ncbi:MAG: hypothetical protein MMC23_001167 [Stictis urceolatum]|nr:hypothetical protein [Stictis urceolata]
MGLIHEPVQTSPSVPVLVGIELKNMTDASSTRMSQADCRIDAVVILDVHYSPLESHQETVITLQSSCNKNDRLALITTNSERLVLPLARVSSRELKGCLSTIQSPAEIPDECYLHKAVSKACMILRNATEEDSPSWRMTTGHIFLLTSNGSAFSDLSINDPLIQTHIICTAALPRRQARHSKNNGWSIYRAGQLPNFHKDERRLLQDDFKSTIQCLFNQAHTGKCSQALSDVQVKFTAGPNSSFQGVMGVTKIPCLRPGESRILFVRVQLEDDLPVGLAEFPRGLRTPSGHMDLEKEIDAILCGRRTILTAKLRYTNPGLLNGTVCEYTQKIEL